MGMFKKAERKKIRLRMALDGPAGSGKTYSGLMFAFALGKKVAVIDTEAGSATKYEGYQPEGSEPWRFDVCELSSFSPSTYEQVIQEAGRLGYDVLLIDSLSHAWQGTDGALEQVDKKKGKEGGNSFTAWKDVTPQQSRMIDAILRSPCHVIATMRTKTEYVLEEQTNASGKKVMVPKKIGLAPIQRQGVEYEFDVVCDIDQAHTLYVSKSRCPSIADRVAHKPGPAFMAPLKYWLEEGMDVPAEAVAAAGLEFRPAAPPQSATATTEAKGDSDAPKLSYKERMRLKAQGQQPAPAPPPPAQAIGREEFGQDELEKQDAKSDSGNPVHPVNPVELPPSEPPFKTDEPTPLLSSQAAAERAAENLPAGPPVAAAAVARRSRQPKAVAKAPVTAVDNGTADGTATREQCDRLESLCERVELPFDARQAMLAKRGADVFRNLSKAQADELIGKLLELELGIDTLAANPRVENELAHGGGAPKN